MNLAESLIDKYVFEEVDAYWDSLEEALPKDPYARALGRIKALLDRFDDADKVDQHTALRAKKIKNPEKLKGLMKAAKQLKLKRSVAAAKLQLSSI